MLIGSNYCPLNTCSRINCNVYIIIVHKHSWLTHIYMLQNNGTVVGELDTANVIHKFTTTVLTYLISHISYLLTNLKVYPEYLVLSGVI